MYSINRSPARIRSIDFIIVSTLNALNNPVSEANAKQELRDLKQLSPRAPHTEQSLCYKANEISIYRG